jgi:hypothetical protein
MEISSVLNPQNIIGNRQGTAEQFQNFMTGGNGPLGSSIVNSTSSNKIVPFERGGVRPITPNFNSIISNISTKTDTVLDTNIKNQENKVQGIVNNIQNVFQTTLQNFTKGYQENLKKIEDSKPSGILEKFFGLYNNVTGFIQFFGDRKNLNKISASLKGLRGLFEDSFETAKLIRKTINKIVKQLSSLPVATPSGGGGFNLDIKVPGSPLKSAAGKMLGGGRGKMLALGAGALGTGIAAGGAINALSGSENIQPAVVQQSIPENLADSLTSIIDRFVNAIDSLIKSAGEKPKSTSRTSGGGGGGGAPKSPPPGGPGGNVNAGDISADTPEEQAFIATVRETEGTAGAEGYNKFFGGSQYGGDLSTKTANEVAQLQKKFLAEGKGTFSGGSSAAVGAGQFMKPEEVVRAMGLDPSKEKFTPELQNKMILYLAKQKRKVDVSKPLSIEDIRILNEEWSGFGPRYGQTKRTLQQTKQIYEQNLKEAKNGMKGGSIVSPISSQVAPAPTQTKANAATISQPVKPQANITTLSIPPQVSSVGGQSQGGGGGGGVSAPPPPSGGSPSVPFLPAGNVDNFLVLYSKMVYNIVDG